MDYHGSEPIEVLRDTHFEGKIRYKGWTYEWVYEKEPDNAYYMHDVRSPTGERPSLDYSGHLPLRYSHFALWVDIGGIDRAFLNKPGPLEAKDLARIASVLSNLDVDIRDATQMKMAVKLALR